MKFTGWKLYCEDKPMKVTGQKLTERINQWSLLDENYCEDKPMKFTGCKL